MLNGHKIDVQKSENGEFLFRILEKYGEKFRPDYEPEQDGEFNTVSLDQAVERILVGFSSFNDVLREISDANLGLCVIFESILRDVDQQMGAITELMKESLGEISLKFRPAQYTYPLPLKPSALFFKPGNLLNQKEKKDGEQNTDKCP